jgi:hypothetical protein
MKRLCFETEETKITRKKGYIEVDDNYTQIYDNLSKLTFKMKSLVEAQLMFYLCTKVSNEGYFYSNQLLYTNFKSFSKDAGGINITDRTIATAIKNLSENKIIIKHAKGQYQLNPFLIWKDSIADRSKLITDLCRSEGETFTEVKYLSFDEI